MQKLLLGGFFTHPEGPAQLSSSGKHLPRGAQSKQLISRLSFPIAHFIYVNYYHPFYVFTCLHACFPHQTESIARSKASSFLLLLRPKTSMQC